MVHADFFSREPRTKRSFDLVVLLSALLFCGFFAPPARAATATTTTLTVTPSNSIAAQQIATLTASVQAGGQPVTVGTVNFFDGKLYLGSVQVVRNASHGYAVGTATVKMALSVGTHSIAATFLPTATLASSTSASQTVTITGTGPTTVTLASAAGSGNTTTLTATLSASGASNPTGSMLFQNQTSNTAVGTVALDPTAFTRSFSTGPSVGAAQPVGVFPIDLNGDGFPDLLTIQDDDFRGTNLVPLISNGDGTFKGVGPDQAYSVPNYPLAGLTPPVVADYNGDGVPDLGFAAGINPVADPLIGDPQVFEMILFLGAGDGTFPNFETLIPATNSPTLSFSATGDFNGDGIPDLTVTDTTSATSPIFYIFPGNGDGTFGTPITNPGIVGVTSLVVQDFNGDGFADMAVTLNNQNAVLILLGKGDGTFQPAVSYPVGTTPTIATILQSRGNGIADLAILSQTDNSLGVLIGNGDGTFLPQVTYPLSITNEIPYQLIAADVTGDGLQDIVASFGPTLTSTTASYSIGVLAGVGDGTYRPLVPYNLPNIFNSAFAVADLNRDGISDLVTPDSGDYTLNVFLNGLQSTVPLTATVYGTGAQQIVAQYSGNSSYSSSTSSAISVTGAGPAPTPTFTLAANPSSLSIAAGMTGTATLSVTPQNGFNSAVTFSCSGLPANSSCSFSPTSVTPTGAAATTTLTIATNVQAAANQAPAKALRGAVISFALLLGFVPFAGVRFARRGWGLSSTGDRFWTLLLFAGTVALTATLVVGCSGGSGSTPTPTRPTTPAGTSSVTINAIQSGSSGTSAKAVLTVAITN
jgi:Bacterial Ig-like domain (group 3)/FG-GAP-like repeat